jgi:hypothetical protein
MSLSLSCPCGARFEVEESFAGQTISCPECQQPVQAPLAARSDVRTSGLALASAVSALVLGFTGIGALLAVVLGFVALISIRRHRNEIAGTGYAVFSIVWGLFFTGLFAFALSRGEVFGIDDVVRERFLNEQVDRTGPLEVRRPEQGFSITRPSPRWGVAKGRMLRDEWPNADVVLVQSSKAVSVEVSSELNAADIDDFRKEIIRRFRKKPALDDDDDDFQPRPWAPTVSIRHDRRLPDIDGAERAELLLDVTQDRESSTHFVRLVRTPAGKMYIIDGRAPRNRYSALESEIRKAIDSFRQINQ